jgi:hypothetical protein
MPRSGNRRGCHGDRKRAAGVADRFEVSWALEAGGRAGHRQDLLAGLTGQVIHIGAGTGTSFAHYPAAVTLGAGGRARTTAARPAAAATPAAPFPSK